MLLKLILNLVMLPFNVVLLVPRCLLKLTVASNMNLWTTA